MLVIENGHFAIKWTKKPFIFSLSQKTAIHYKYYWKNRKKKKEKKKVNKILGDHFLFVEIRRGI